MAPSPSEPEVKKRLELSAQKAAQGPQITIQDIDKKLKRAAEKRKISQTYQISPKSEERRLNAWETKKWQERQAQENREKLEKNLSKADEKRKSTWEQKRQKLREHIQKVE